MKEDVLVKDYMQSFCAVANIDFAFQKFELAKLDATSQEYSGPKLLKVLDPSLATYLCSPLEPELEDIIVTTTLNNFVARVVLQVIEFILLEQVSGAHLITAREESLQWYKMVKLTILFESPAFFMLISHSKVCLHLP